MNCLSQVLMVASQFGLEGLPEMAREGYMSTFPTLLVNSLTWLRGDRSGNTAVAIRVGVQAVANILTETTFKGKVVRDYSGTLGAGVYVSDAYSVNDLAENLVAFVKNGNNKE